MTIGHIVACFWFYISTSDVTGAVQVSVANSSRWEEGGWEGRGRGEGLVRGVISRRGEGEGVVAVAVLIPTYFFIYII